MNNKCAMLPDMEIAIRQDGAMAVNVRHVSDQQAEKMFGRMMDELSDLGIELEPFSRGKLGTKTGLSICG